MGTALAKESHCTTPLRTTLKRELGVAFCWAPARPAELWESQSLTRRLIGNGGWLREEPENWSSQKSCYPG